MARFSDRVREALERAPRFAEFAVKLDFTEWLIGFEWLIVSARRLYSSAPEHAQVIVMYFHILPCISLIFTYIYSDPCNADICDEITDNQHWHF